MTTRIADAMVSSVVFFNSADTLQVEDLAARRDEEALEYLRAKFPEADEKIFYTDYTGRVRAHVVDAVSVCKAKKFEQICANCQGVCSLPDEGKPVISIGTARGFDYLSVGWTDAKCRYKAAKESDDNFDRLFSRSGLTLLQRECTFSTYHAENEELKAARQEALEAMRKGSNLVLAGAWGTGKTHLAIAIALNVMRSGRQAIFRASSKMADELREANFTGGYYELMREFSGVPCLVIDDLGKDRGTDAWCDYLYQIIDYRYTHGLQTIITTNAMTMEELDGWWRADYIQPMISRLLERGSWVTIRHADNYRLRRDK